MGIKQTVFNEEDFRMVIWFLNAMNPVFGIPNRDQ